MHLHLARFHTALTPERFSAYLLLLDREERNRLQRFHREKDRHLFAASRAFLRQTLSHYVKIPPDQLRFVVNRHGKPSLDRHSKDAVIHFNLAHASDLVVVAVSRGGEVGVDVERLDRDVNPQEIGDRFFSPEESADLRATPAAGRLLKFFQYWTLKEAFLKARGQGLSAALDRFTIHFVPDGRASLSTVSEQEENFAAWTLFHFEPSPEHVVAACVSSPAGPDACQWKWEKDLA
jgi:4'-phosphopantetheinyl transferase